MAVFETLLYVTCFEKAHSVKSLVLGFADRLTAAWEDSAEARLAWSLKSIPAFDESKITVLPVVSDVP